jgi:hypothetical protein
LRFKKVALFGSNVIRGKQPPFPWQSRYFLMMRATLLGRYNRSMNTATSDYLKLSSVFCIDSFSSRNSCSEMYVVTFITSSPRRKIIASKWMATKA